MHSPALPHRSRRTGSVLHSAAIYRLHSQRIAQKLCPTGSIPCNLYRAGEPLGPWRAHDDAVRIGNIVLMVFYEAMAGDAGHSFANAQFDIPADPDNLCALEK